MRLTLAIIVCKLLYFIGSRMGKGSSLPGRVALAICPGALKKLKLPSVRIALTGSNGKTSTTEMLAHVLEANGMSVSWNREGANQIEGIATLLLRAATLKGAVKRDALVFECDERYARHTFESVRPSALVVTNLCRDQLTRNGHPEFILDCIRTAVNVVDSAGLQLILNADDPYVAALAAPLPGDPEGLADNYCFFGVSQDMFQADGGPEKARPPRCTGGMYDDGAFCPVCKQRMTYGYRIMAHMGGFHCGSCGHSRPLPRIEADGLDYKTGELALSCGVKAASGGKTRDQDRRPVTLRLAFPSLANAYNIAAAIGAASVAGVSPEDAARALDGYELTGGRTLRFSVNGRGGILLVSKHENSLSYNQSLSWAVGQKILCTVVIMVDSISRKYYTSDTSWLWDVDFDILADCYVQQIILTGRYLNELAARFAMTAVDPGKIRYCADPNGLRECIGRVPVPVPGPVPVPVPGPGSGGEIFALTCFADKDKLLKALDI